jgi:hypothetical protein
VKAEIFAEWLRRQGHIVVRTESSYWYDAGPRTFQAFPYHWMIQPTREELHRLMMGENIMALRYSSHVSASEGKISYHVTLRGPYNLELLRHQARGGIRRGLKASQIEQISFKRLGEEGWLLQKDTLERQGRDRSMRQDEWMRICLAAEGLPGFEAWGAIVKGELAASLLTSRVENMCYVPYALSHRKFLRDHVNNALFYSVCCDMLSREGISEMFFNLQSLDAPESVDEFKFRMGFAANPVRQCVALHPLLKPLAMATTHKLISKILHRYPSNHYLAKTEGMIRFYLRGRLPLWEQEWPEALAGLKAKIDKGDAEEGQEPDASSKEFSRV